MWSLPALVYARGLCAWPDVFVRSNQRGVSLAWSKVLITEKHAGGDAFEFRGITTTRQV